MTTTVIPNPRWISLTLNFPGVGSITRNINIHQPIECDDRIADRLFNKFYARPYVAPELADPVPVETTNTIVAPISPDPNEVDPILDETALDRMLIAINNCQTVEEIQLLGFNAAKALALLEATPIDLATISQIVPAKTLAGTIAKYE